VSHMIDLVARLRLSAMSGCSIIVALIPIATILKGLRSRAAATVGINRLHSGCINCFVCQPRSLPDVCLRNLCEGCQPYVATVHTNVIQSHLS